MKKQILFFLTLAAISFTTRSQSQPLYFQWAAAFQGNSTSTPRSLAVCPNGDVLSTGSFSDTVDFDPGPGIAEVTTIDYQFGDLFVARLDASGNYVNAFGIGGIDEQDEGNNILTDAQNNVYSAGFFYYTADFDPSPLNTFNLTSLGNADMYLAKFDASNQLVWAKKRGISQDEYCNDAAIDSAGNIYSVGLWNTDVYVYKSNPMGDTVWTRRIAATQFYSSAYSVATDAAGNVYVTGLHYGLTLFPGTLGGSDVFVLKYNTNGTLLWSRTFGGTSSETGTGIAVDGSGNVYTIGNFRGLVDFNPSTAAVDTFFLTSNGSSDIFITKFDSSGTFRWAVHAGGLASDLARDIVTDALGNIYVSSVFVNMATYGSTVLTAVSSVSSDVAISKLDSNGNFIWTQQIGGTGTESSSGLDIDASGTLYLSGYFTDTADFDPGPGVFTMITKGATDVFVVKLSQLALTTEELVASATNVTVYPNPAGDEFTIRSAAALQNITLHSVIGEKILGIDNPSLTQKISIRDLPPGMYLVNGIGNGFRFSKKLIKSN